MDFSNIESALVTAGWRFDAERERFTDGSYRIDYRHILKLLPGLTLDDLAAYVTHKHEEWLTNKPCKD
jgi:hypothetical protein